MLKKLFSIGKVLQAGEELSNPSIWKNRQNAINAILTIIGVSILFLPEEFHVSGEAAESIAGGIATIGGLINGYLTTATSKKVGLNKKVK